MTDYTLLRDGQVEGVTTSDLLKITHDARILADRYRDNTYSICEVVYKPFQEVKYTGAVQVPDVSVSPSETIQERLERFLDRHGVYDTFCTATKRYTGKDFASYANNTYLPSLIAYAFVWGNTNQGYTFWSELGKKWKKVCTDENL